MTPLRDAESATAGVPVVRRLEWRSVSDRVDEADTPIGEYQVAYYTEVSEGEGWSAVFRDNEEIGEYPTSSIAMSACQADYERRGREIINPDFLSELDTARAEIKRLRGMWVEADEDAKVQKEFLAVSDAALTAAQARIAELEHTVEFVQRWAWRETPATNAERLSVIKYHPGIKPADATLSPAVKEPK